MSRRLRIDGPKRIGYETYEPRTPLADEVVSETLYSGISAGTEMCYYRGTGPELSGSWDPVARLYDAAKPPTFSYPLSYGYENVGRVTEVGSGVNGFEPGDLVFSYAPHESLAIQKAQDIWKLPEHISPRAANMLAVLRLCFNGVLAADLHLGETVVVFGLGVLGQLIAQLCRLSGARVVGVDLIASRRDLARSLGAHEVIDPKATDLPVAIRAMTGGLGADAAIEVTASERGLESAVRCVAPHSKVIAMSFYQGTSPLRFSPEFHYNCIRVQVSQAMQVATELRHRWTAERICAATAGLLPRLQLEPLVSHEFAFDQAAEAYKLVDERPQEALQVVLRYPAAETPRKNAHATTGSTARG